MATESTAIQSKATFRPVTIARPVGTVLCLLAADVTALVISYGIKNWSVWLDVYILARTVGAVITAKGAY